MEAGMSRPVSDDIERAVIDCVAYASGADASRISPETDLIFGLGIAGDDGVELIDALREATGAALRDYDFFQHFGPEAAFTSHSSRPLTVHQLAERVRRDLGIS
jgi:hypothetical protein